LKELEQLKGDIGHADTIRARYQAFTSMIEMLNQNPISSRSALTTAREYFQDLRRKVQQDRLAIRTGSGREALDRLLAQLDAVLGQLGG
jgi:hypothetical protein